MGDDTGFVVQHDEIWLPAAQNPEPDRSPDESRKTALRGGDWFGVVDFEIPTPTNEAAIS